MLSYNCEPSLYITSHLSTQTYLDTCNGCSMKLRLRLDMHIPVTLTPITITTPVGMVTPIIKLVSLSVIMLLSVGSVVWDREQTPALRSNTVFMQISPSRMSTPCTLIVGPVEIQLSKYETKRSLATSRVPLIRAL